MKRKRIICYFSTVVALIVVMTIVLAAFIFAFSGTLVSEKINIMERRLAKHAARKGVDDNDLLAKLKKKYVSADVMEYNGTIYYDILLQEKTREILVVRDNGNHIQKYLLNNCIITENTTPRSVTTISNNFKNDIPLNDDQQLSVLDLFLDNPCCLPVLEGKETNKTFKDISVLESLGYSKTQTFRIYENQNDFKTTALNGTVFTMGTSIATVAFIKKVALKTLIPSIQKCEISLDYYGRLTTDVLFCTFKRQT